MKKLTDYNKAFFVGIGGISMSGLAILAKGYGFDVGGSDMNPSERTEMLASKGIKIYNTQEAANIIEFQPDYIVKTAAILPKNKELAQALEMDFFPELRERENHDKNGQTENVSAELARSVRHLVPIQMTNMVRVCQR